MTAVTATCRCDLTAHGAVTDLPGPCSEPMTAEDLLCDVCRAPAHGHMFSEHLQAWTPFPIR